MEHQQTEITIAIVAASILFILFAGFIITFLFFYNKKKQLHLKELKYQQKMFEQEAIRSELEIKEQTMRHIAEEIHDNVGQVMLLAKMNLNKILMAKNDEAVEDVRDLLAQAINDLRDISRSLHTNQIASSDLCTAIKSELGRVERTGLLQTAFSVKGDVIEIESSRMLIIFRMIQEILQNIIKHAKSTQVNINLSFKNEFVILDIEDNGIGFNAEKELKSENKQKGSGLLNLQNRSNVLNANLIIKSRPGEGTKINIKLPLYNITNAISKSFNKSSAG